MLNGQTAYAVTADQFSYFRGGEGLKSSKRQKFDNYVAIRSRQCSSSVAAGMYVVTLNYERYHSVPAHRSSSTCNTEHLHSLIQTDRSTPLLLGTAKHEVEHLPLL